MSNASVQTEISGPIKKAHETKIYFLQNQKDAEAAGESFSITKIMSREKSDSETQTDSSSKDESNLSSASTVLTYLHNIALQSLEIATNLAESKQSDVKKSKEFELFEKQVKILREALYIQRKITKAFKKQMIEVNKDILRTAEIINKQNNKVKIIKNGVLCIRSLVNEAIVKLEYKDPKSISNL